MTDLFDQPAEEAEVIDEPHDGIHRCAWCDRPATTTATTFLDHDNATTFLDHDNAACAEHARRYGRQPRKDREQ